MSGVLGEGIAGRMPGDADRHFKRLIEARVLVPVGRDSGVADHGRMGAAFSPLPKGFGPRVDTGSPRHNRHVRHSVAARYCTANAREDASACSPGNGLSEPPVWLAVFHLTRLHVKSRGP